MVRCDAGRSLPLPSNFSVASLSTSPESSFTHRPARRTGRIVLGIAGGLALLIGGGVLADYWSAKPVDIRSRFVGRDRCLECHQDEAKAFAGSHHDLAMDLATDETVLADFDDVTFEQFGIESRFYRDGEKFMVRTEGETGELEDFEVKYVFGVTPLQQYMVEFDRTPEMADDEVARVQVLRLSWDTEKGRWFYLAPPDVDEKLEPDDPLHWTGVAQRWQIMCAECHSTNLQRNFDVKTNSYHTTFSEIDVSCEACHGPGSLHIELAESNSLFWDRRHGYGLAMLKGDDPTNQLETCAPCHSRRGVIDYDFQPGERYHDHFNLETLTDATYHADGQIKDEVYVFGSFIQSKMYHQGIRCTDCHDPHSLELKFPGNEACTNCHQHAAGKYDVPSHHHHAPGTEGAMCVNCHMPHTTYMAVDERRDHSLRVPRPDLSVKLGTPNACSHCHVQDQLESLKAEINGDDADVFDRYDMSQYANWLLAAEQGNEAVAAAVAKTDKWCDDACAEWYGKDRKTPKHFAEAIAAFRSGQDDGAEQLLRVAMTRDETVPDIVRATALRELTQVPPQARGRSRIDDAAIATINDDTQSPFVRAAAVSSLEAAPPALVRKTLMPLLEDSSPLVRNEATRVLALSDAYSTLTDSERTRVDLALRDVKKVLMNGADRGGAHMTWGILCERTGKAEAAATAYQIALRLQPEMTGPRTNLAGLLEQLAQRQPGPTAAEYLQYAAKLREEEVPLLVRDAELAPEVAEIQYRCGLALYLAGRNDDALEYLERAVEIEPDVEQFRVAVRLLKEKMQQP